MKIMKSKLKLLAVLAVILIWSSIALANGVHALFDPSTPRGGPFPSDLFTVVDPAHNTGVRINLPLPDCSARPSDCRDLDVINTLDGFNVQPRLSIPFDGPIDVRTITRHSVLLVSLGDTLGDGDRGGRVIGINQIVWANVGVTPSAGDRMNAVNEFGAATTTSEEAARARALRRVAENSTLAQQEFNRAFVLMQYFGYLRRNPNDPPEPGLNFDGYNFWLTKLNQFNGNFVNAEMVRAFLVSTEYRQRFGQP